MDGEISHLIEDWTGPEGPESHVVVTSRVRHARNFDRLPFPPCAEAKDLERVCNKIDGLIKGASSLGAFRRLDLSACTPLERMFLKESHVISPELEHGGEHRSLYINRERSCAVMVNEEDHLRMYCLLSGLQLEAALSRINTIDETFSKSLQYAFSDKYGFLTACPSNVGTGMRASVMLHLPGLVMMGKIEEIINSLPQTGMSVRGHLAVRGYYGENSEFLGDFYQISNEVTLGKTELEILELLQSIVSQIIQKEVDAREALFTKKKWYAEDVIWRAYAILTHARILESSEAFKLLSPIRLGIEKGYFSFLTHHQLNRLVVAVQPAHVQLAEGENCSVEQRDIARARFLRSAFQQMDSQN